MKTKYIPEFQKFIKDTVDAYPSYNQAKYFNELFKMFNKKHQQVLKVWGE